MARYRGTFFGLLMCCQLLVIWWLAASRAIWKEWVVGFGGPVASEGFTITGATGYGVLSITAPE